MGRNSIPGVRPRKRVKLVAPKHLTQPAPAPVTARNVAQVVRWQTPLRGVLEWTHMRAARHTCTKRQPWSPELGPLALHPDAEPDGKTDPGSVYFVCPHCMTRFQMVCT